MKITIRDKNGVKTTFNDAKVIEVEDKVGREYRIVEDFIRGLEITAENENKIYVEPRYGNQVTVIASERI